MSRGRKSRAEFQEVCDLTESDLGPPVRPSCRVWRQPKVGGEASRWPTVTRQSRQLPLKLTVNKG